METDNTTPLQNESNFADVPNPITANQPITTEQISAFLQNNPYFFEQHASLLADIHLPSPHGNGTISLTERQQLAQRDKIRVLEVKLAELIEYAEENDATSTKVHALSLDLLKQHDLNTLQDSIATQMQKSFDVSQTLLRVWLKPIDATLAGETIFNPVDDTLSDWVLALSEPYCGAKPEAISTLLNADVQSCCVIPLKAQAESTKSFGVLILGANSAQRFKTGMGTHYLNRIGELVSAALLPQL